MMKTTMKRTVTARQFFKQLSAQTMHLVDDFYAVDTVFKDPVVDLHGREALKKYYANMYAQVDYCKFEFGDEIVADTNTTLVWTMYLKAPKLNRGKEIIVDGVSVIKFDGEHGQAVYHRDYFDMGAFVYEGLPLVGGVIRFAKKKMSEHST